MKITYRLDVEQKKTKNKKENGYNLVAVLSLDLTFRKMLVGGGRLFESQFHRLHGNAAPL